MIRQCGINKGKLKVGANVKDMQQLYMLENVLHRNVAMYSI